LPLKKTARSLSLVQEENVMFHPKEPLRGKTLLTLERQLTEEREAYYEKVERRRAIALQRRSSIRAAFYSAVRMILLSNIGIWWG
jgi:hypothetical protein